MTDCNEGFELYNNVSNSSNSISTSAKVRSLLGFSLEGHSDKSKVGSLLVNKIGIEEFQPTAEYVEDSFNQPAVLQHLKRKKYRVPIYMICGVKTAIGGGKIATENAQDRGVSASGQVKLSVKGVTDLATAELAFSSSKNKSEGRQIVATNQFVFAYRLREIKYDKKLKTKPYDQEVVSWHGEGDHIPHHADPENIEALYGEFLEYPEGVGYQFVDELAMDEAETRMDIDEQEES